MSKWAVMSPEYADVVPTLDDGTGPEEWGRDYVEVEAQTKREAVRLGYQLLKSQPWFKRWWDRDRHPYAYITAERFDDE